VAWARLVGAAAILLALEGDAKGSIWVTRRCRLHASFSDFFKVIWGAARLGISSEAGRNFRSTQNLFSEVNRADRLVGRCIVTVNGIRPEVAAIFGGI
jgi:hypothetical protein